ncbi:MAG: hypothetical protein CBC88_03330 [Candidatus Pelagibacter sp. TMED128]|nr:MAG: hypothetical protein CBC88_03330 [Candidatus Pelagibacter sp. TMED128]|tara:strand:- start:910 stop:2241 length:1332 start_codon:yes stop_codon:yes gene_type:complete
MESSIRLINHASVKFQFDNIKILTDPWYTGSVFHKSWKLIYQQTENEILNIIQDITHIFISHEHPDHFSPQFFLDKNIKKILLKNRVKILFQETKDKRVKKFLEKQGYMCIEVSDGKYFELSNEVKIKIIKFGYIDSSLIIETPQEKILNLNDCPLNNKEEIEIFKKKHGSFDILLSQFSYAAWKGGKDNSEYRKIAAKEKINTLVNQYKILDCKYAVPFASFIYFSNSLNNYMNDHINNPVDLYNKIKNEINVIIMSPNEKQNLKDLTQNPESINFWKSKYQNIDKLPIENFNFTVDYENLKLQYEIYKKKIFNLNSKILIYIASKIKFLNFFQPINIFLLDHNKNYEFSLIEGFKIKKENISDIKMHSESLSFIFKNDFGFDTLTVNGCFEASKEGFIKSTKSFALGSLNSMGLKLNLGLLFNLKLILFFFSLLKKVKNKL